MGLIINISSIGDLNFGKLAGLFTTGKIEEVFRL